MKQKAEQQPRGQGEKEHTGRFSIQSRWRAIARAPALIQVQKFLRTPKGFLLPFLLLLAALGAPSAGIGQAALNTLAAVVTALVMDLGVVRLVWRKWIFPSGALITGLIVAVVLSPQEPWYVASAATVVALGSKHTLKFRRKPIFNPAAVGLLFAIVVFSSEQNWWGAVATLPAWWIGVLIVAGYLIIDRVNKFPQVLAFLGSYFLLFTVAALMGNPGELAEVFRVPLINTVLFFAFIMLTDPPTSPGNAEEQVQFGAIVALASFLVYLLVGGLSFLLVGLLIGNVLVALQHKPSSPGSRQMAA